ncbi:MAG: L-ribulose-5-phosphate 3-epimerase [Desulfofustis sp.]|nr:L-ribulose-5-phosphate 3-epimerase [Desulfofustis sp.]NNK57552.1 L-ribulose-5-phosphate 3-epimerase [Desulfofustis sp.]
MKREDIKLGIYEKALPPGISWEKRLAIGEKLGFHFVEISVDETDERLARLEWTLEERKDFCRAVMESPLTVPTMCLSGHRRFPLGSRDPDTRAQALNIMEKAVRFAVDTGVRTIQLAGYDVYYEESDSDTRKWYLENMQKCLDMAAREQVMLAMEIMDHPFMNSILKFINMKQLLNSPWFTVYPDIGNLSAWGNDVPEELLLGFPQIVALHLKDTLAVTSDHPGTFKEVDFGNGCVDFPGAFTKLKELGYAGPFLIEMWTEKANDPEAEISSAREWIFEKMEEGGLIDG